MIGAEVHARAVAALGPLAHPTNRIALLTDGDVWRLIQQWEGDLGEMWLPVPKIVVAALLPED